jgi:hypothetical protein
MSPAVARSYGDNSFAWAWNSNRRIRDRRLPGLPPGADAEAARAIRRSACKSSGPLYETVNAGWRPSKGTSRQHRAQGMVDQTWREAAKRITRSAGRQSRPQTAPVTGSGSMRSARLVYAAREAYFNTTRRRSNTSLASFLESSLPMRSFGMNCRKSASIGAP